MICKVGLLGGTFNPVHKAHLRLAAVVTRECGLDRIIIIPAASPPHKERGDIIDVTHRYRMLQLASRGLPYIEISDLEIKADRPSYTFDTLRMLPNRADGKAVKYYFISGHDAFVEIETWHRWKEVLEMTNFIVVRREGYPDDRLEEVLRRNDYRALSADKRFWEHRSNGRTVQVLNPSIGRVSSTYIRECIASGRPWRHLVPDSVADYIDDHNLYLSGDDKSKTSGDPGRYDTQGRSG